MNAIWDDENYWENLIKTSIEDFTLGSDLSAILIDINYLRKKTKIFHLFNEAHHLLNKKRSQVLLSRTKINFSMAIFRLVGVIKFLWFQLESRDANLWRFMLFLEF